ncbi:hypothetical protein C0J52_11480 [Blattella germanica]|nr:hypothetical protein C0J52_11480 [Blattella germanica]
MKHLSAFQECQVVVNITHYHVVSNLPSRKSAVIIPPLSESPGGRNMKHIQVFIIEECVNGSKFQNQSFPVRVILIVLVIFPKLIIVYKLFCATVITVLVLKRVTPLRRLRRTDGLYHSKFSTTALQVAVSVRTSLLYTLEGYSRHHHHHHHHGHLQQPQQHGRVTTYHHQQVAHHSMAAGVLHQHATTVSSLTPLNASKLHESYTSLFATGANLVDANDNAELALVYKCFVNHLGNIPFRSKVVMKEGKYIK